MGEKQEIYDAAIRLLARRDYSRNELTDRFKRKYTDDMIELVLDELQQAGYQSDQRFAESFCRNRIAQRYGKQRIQQELYHRGITNELITRVFEEQECDWYQLAHEAWLKRFSAPPEQGDYKGYGKQMRYLLQRGFSNDEARAAVSNKDEFE